jgi:hypothetical protein
MYLLLNATTRIFKNELCQLRISCETLTGVQHDFHVTVSEKSQILNLIKTAVKLRLRHLIPATHYSPNRVQAAQEASRVDQVRFGEAVYARADFPSLSDG